MILINPLYHDNVVLGINNLVAGRAILHTHGLALKGNEKDTSRLGPLG